MNAHFFTTMIWHLLFNCEEDDELHLSSSFTFAKKKTKDDEQPRCSLSSFIIVKEKKQRMTMSNHVTYCHPFVLGKQL